MKTRQGLLHSFDALALILDKSLAIAKVITELEDAARCLLHCCHPLYNDIYANYFLMRSRNCCDQTHSIQLIKECFFSKTDQVIVKVVFL